MNKSNEVEFRKSKSNNLAFKIYPDNKMRVDIIRCDSPYSYVVTNVSIWIRSLKFNSIGWGEGTEQFDEHDREEILEFTQAYHAELSYKAAPEIIPDDNPLVLPQLNSFPSFSFNNENIIDTSIEL